MTPWKRSCGLFFARELERLRRLARGLAWGTRSSRPRGAPGRARTRGQAPAQLEGPPRRGGRRIVGPAAALAVSLLLHAGLAAGLILAWGSRGERRDRDPGTPTVVLRLFAPPRPVPARAPEPARREPTPRPAPARLDEAPVREPPAALAAPEPAPEARPEVPRRGEAPPLPEVPSVAPGDRPRPLGLGAAPPPLPRTGPGNGPRPAGLPSRLEGKAAALREHGGGAQTEGAVARGLRWLAEHQDDDGSWSADGFQRHCRHTVSCPGKGLSEFDVGVTALAVLAFLGAGHLPEPQASPGARGAAAQGAGEASPYVRNARSGIESLLARQDGSGAFGRTGDNYVYNHAIATLALAEACLLTGARRYRDSLEAALRFSASSQQDGGGWDYTSRSSGRNDLSITGWQVMAFRSAGLAGAPVHEGTLDRARHFLRRAVTEDGEGIYANLGQEAGRRGANMVAVGLLSKLYLGALDSERPVRRAAERLLREVPDWRSTSDWERTYQSYYYWYTGSLALFHLGGDAWKAWNVLLLRQLLPLQASKGHEDGSWPPEESWIGVSGGRVYATATCVLTLQTYYRYEPLFPRKKG
ncbi:MAG: terpene cyclase/mutase family protein [Planctomycetes bacterium]|nr:terpene cyclase/mutase family protein [Planctomycetota bacterium]